jgi:hypothetical protein
VRNAVALVAAGFALLLSVPARADDCRDGHDIRQWHAILAALPADDPTHQTTINPMSCKIMLLVPDERAALNEVTEACRQASAMKWIHRWAVVGYLANSETEQAIKPECGVGP